MLAEYEGKRWDKRIFAKIIAACPAFEIDQSQAFGQLSLRWRDGAYTYTLTIATQLVNVIIDTAKIKDNNGSLFRGRYERDAERVEFLKDPSKAKAIADAINAFAKAKAALDAITASFGGYGKLVNATPLVTFACEEARAEAVPAGRK